MSASRRRHTSRCQPGIASMYSRTGASPSPLAICGLPPESSAGPFAAAGLGTAGFGAAFGAVAFLVAAVLAVAFFGAAFLGAALVGAALVGAALFFGADATLSAAA